MIKFLTGILGALLLLFGAFLGWVWLSTFQPDQIQPAAVERGAEAPLLPSDGKIKIMNWNVQFMAGKGYYFYYESGPDNHPSSRDIAETLGEVAEVIKSENPDIVLLQEIDDGAKRTGHKDQLRQLLKLLPESYGCHTSAFCWKASFVPQPHILGSVGMKLSIISKYKVDLARRHQLPLKPDNWIVRQFDLKRAVLEARLPRKEGSDLVVFNTHLTAFAYGSDVRIRQVKEIKNLLEDRTEKKLPWIIGGDFNLTPPSQAQGKSPHRDEQKTTADTEAMEALFENYSSVPRLKEVNGPTPEEWYTHFPNDPRIDGPNKTIDYFFLSPTLSLGEHYVRQEGTLEISDHLPLMAEVNM